MSKASSPAVLDFAQGVAELSGETVVTLRICDGSVGVSVYLNDYCIAGPRRNGVMKTRTSWPVRIKDIVCALHKDEEP